MVRQIAQSAVSGTELAFLCRAMAQEKTQPHNKDESGGETRTEKEERKERNSEAKKEDHQTGAGRHRGTDKHGTE